jgi:hypothetical protein
MRLSNIRTTFFLALVNDGTGQSGLGQSLRLSCCNFAQVAGQVTRSSVGQSKLERSKQSKLEELIEPRIPELMWGRAVSRVAAPVWRGGPRGVETR